VILEQLDYWHWWVIGIILIIFELFLPGAFFLWMGIAAALVGLILVIVPTLAWQYQIILFAILSIVSIVVWRMYLIKHPTQSDKPTLNMRGEQYVGRVFTLSEPIVNGVGKIRVDDSVWKIEGDDCVVGTRIKVIEANGAVLRVIAI
jgi:membrane protein implicated in regulation of membrane protease activity